jgi:hypothetical protein
LTKDDDAKYAGPWCHLDFFNLKREVKHSQLPCNGGNRWRLSRWLTGGFRSCWLLRCTFPQLSVAQQQVLVPLIADLFVVLSIPVYLGFVNSYVRVGIVRD